MQDQNSSEVETVDELVEAVLDIAREQSHDDARIIIADRIRKHVTPYLTALLRAKETIRQWNGMGMSGEAEKMAWDAYQHSPEMKQINAALAELGSASSGKLARNGSGVFQS